MGAQVVPLRQAQATHAAPVDPATLPDPGPYVLADVRELIDRSGRSFADIAHCVNLVCHITWVDEFLVERWYSGEGEVLLRHARVLLWLAGFNIPAVVPALAH